MNPFAFTTKLLASRTSRKLAALALAGLLALVAAGTARATVSRPQGGFGYTTLKCVNSSTHQVQWIVDINADTGQFVQTVAFELYYWNGSQWLTVAPWTQINLRDLAMRTGSFQYWSLTTPPLPGGYQTRYFYTYYHWFYGGVWNRALGEMTSVNC